MKQCPQCYKTYPEDIRFCLDDGSVLLSGNDENYEEVLTVITPKPHGSSPPAANQPARWIYPLLGLAAALVMILVFAAVLLYLVKRADSQETPGTTGLNKNINYNPGVNQALPSPSVQTIPSAKDLPQTNSAPITPADTDDGNGRFPEGSARLLTNADLAGKSDWDLRIMRNEIFARHGYIFNKPELKQYFFKQSWYTPKYTDVSPFLSSIEKQNAQFLKDHE